jgi:hypothetical protein
MHRSQVIPIGITRATPCQPIRGLHGNYLVGTQIESLRMSGPLDGVWAGASCWPSFVSLSPSLWVALTQLAGFALEPWVFHGPIWGPFWVRFPYRVLPLRHSGHDVRGVGEVCKCGFIVPYLLCFLGAYRFASSDMKMHDYKSKWMPLRTLTSSHTISCCLLVLFLASEKRGRKREKRERDIFRVKRMVLLLPSRAMVGQGWTPSEVTQELTTLWVKGSWWVRSSWPTMWVRTLCPPRRQRDPWSPSRHFMSEDSVCHRTDSSARCYSIIA